jgi:hypothetical protein
VHRKVAVSETTYRWWIIILAPLPWFVAAIVSAILSALT